MEVIKGGRSLTIIEQLADDLYAVLPAPTRSEIASRLSKRLKWDVSVQHVDATLALVRERREHLGWTVPYAKRGPSTDRPERFMAIHMTRDGVFASDETKEISAKEISPHYWHWLRSRGAWRLLPSDGNPYSVPSRSPYISFAGDDLAYVAGKITENIAEFRANGTTGQRNDTAGR